MPAAAEDDEEANRERFEAALLRINRRIARGDASADGLRLVADRAEEVAARLEAWPPGVLWGWTGSGSNEKARAIFAIGLARPPVTGNLSADDGFAEGIVTFDASHEGPGGHVHGGIIAGVLDDASAIVASLAGAPDGLTRRLAITYHRRVPLGVAIAVRAELAGGEGRTIRVHTTLRDGDVVYAEAEAAFTRPRAAT